MNKEELRIYNKNYYNTHKNTEKYKKTVENYRNTDAYKVSVKKSRNKPERLQYQQEYGIVYRKTNDSKLYHKQYRQSTMGKLILSKAHLKHNFGISIEEYNKMLVSQEHKCLGCKRLEGEFKRKFAVDHDHKTNKIRGLLCIHCNIILGHAKDCEDTLLNLVNHLRKSREQ